MSVSAELVQMLPKRHLRAFEQIFVVLAMHGEMTGQGRGEEMPEFETNWPL